MTLYLEDNGMSKQKRDLVVPITVRMTPKEDRWFRDAAKALNMDMSDLFRKCAYSSIPQLLGNRHNRRVEFEDLILDEKSLSDD